MKKIIIFTVFCFTVSYPLFSELTRPKNVHKKATWDNEYKTWKYRNKDFRIAWFANGKYKYKRLHLNKILDKKYAYYKNGSINYIEFERYFNMYSLGDSKVDWIRIGLWRKYYKNGEMKRAACYTLGRIPQGQRYSGMVISVKCGKEIIFDRNGRVLKIVQHKKKCKYGCKDIKSQLKELDKI